MTDTAVQPVRGVPALRQTVHRRTVLDVRRLVWFAVLLVLGVVLATGLDETMTGLEADLLEAVAWIPATVAGLVVAVVAVLYLALLLGTPVVLLITRRFRTFGVGTLAIVVASAAFVLLRDVLPDRTTGVPDGNETAFAVGAGWPPGGALAGYAAAAIVVGVELSVRWKRAVWVFLAVLAVFRVITAQEPPLDVLLAIGVGGVVGASVLVSFGRTILVASAEGIRAALESAGMPIVDVTATDPGRTAWEYRVTTGATPLLVKVVGAESQQLDSLYRAYRRVRLRDVGDDTAYSSARRAVAVEALLTVYTGERGARTPTVRALAPVTGEDVLLAVDEIAGTALDEVEDASLTDDVLRQCWEQVEGLRGVQVAHRSVDLGHFLLDPQGRVWLLDFSFGQPAAEDTSWPAMSPSCWRPPTSVSARSGRWRPPSAFSGRRPWPMR